MRTWITAALAMFAFAACFYNLGHERGVASQRAAACPDIEVAQCDCSVRCRETSQLSIRFAVTDLDPLILCRCGVEGGRAYFETHMGGTP